MADSKAGLSALFNKLTTHAPTARDGMYEQQSALPTDAVQKRSWGKEIRAGLTSGRAIKNTTTLLKLGATAATGAEIDDRKLLLEETVEMLSGLDPSSPLGAKASGALIGLLSDDILTKGIKTTLAPEHRFRSADGSNNSISNPRIGTAGSAYARTVAPKHPLPAHTLPHPAEIFNRVMRRPAGSFVEHPGGLSGLFTAFATTVIHTIFRTQRGSPDSDVRINETTSYVDLSIVYGWNTERQAQIRSFENGRIFNDVIAEDRLMALPPSVVAVAVIFSRNHNLIADTLFGINERGTFKPWAELDAAGRKAQDEEIFQTARLINVGYYAQVVLHDYLRSILGLVSTPSAWVLDPRTSESTAGTGQGAHVSIEFNFLYRWHATMSAPDEAYVERWLRHHLPDERKGAAIDDLTEADFAGVFKSQAKSLGPDPRRWNHYEMKRGADGRFKDSDLAKALIDAHETPAHAFGAKGVPAAMKGVEIMGMAMARSKYLTCSLNEFRRFLKLAPVKSFAEFNSDPEVALAFEQFYGHVDNIELYPGLLCEETKKPMVGAGLCPGYTQSRAILSDAVALVRGDRFLTDNYDSGSLTAYGFESTAASDPNNGSYGGFLPSLFMKNLPNSFRYNSLCVQFPLQTPKSMIPNLERIGVLAKYDTSRPIELRPWQYVSDPAAVDAILDDSASFAVPYKASITSFTVDAEHSAFAMGTDDKALHDRSRRIIEALYYPSGWETESLEFIVELTRELLRTSSYPVAGTTVEVNIIRDVINRVFITYTARQIGIPLKTPTSKGLVTPHELWLMLTGLFSYTAINFAPASSWKLKETSLKSAAMLRKLIGARLTEVRLLGRLARGVTKIRKATGGKPTGRLGTLHPLGLAFYRRADALRKAGHSKTEVINAILGMTVASSTQPADVLAQLTDFYLRPANAAALADLRRLSGEPLNAESRQRLLGYWWEGSRLSKATLGGPRYVERDVDVVVDGHVKRFVKGDRVLVDFHQLRRADGGDPVPLDVDPTRPVEQYRTLGRGLHNCVATPLVLATAPVLMREIFRLGQLERSPGAAGTLRSFAVKFGGTEAVTRQYLDNASMPFPFPTSLIVRYKLGTAVVPPASSLKGTSPASSAAEAPSDGKLSPQASRVSREKA